MGIEKARRRHCGGGGLVKSREKLSDFILVEGNALLVADNGKIRFKSFDELTI